MNPQQTNSRYNSFVGYFKKTFGQRLQKIVIDAGFTCPNRDGTISRGGCTYCDNLAFHPNYSTSDRSIAWQIEEGIVFHKNRYRVDDEKLDYLAELARKHVVIIEYGIESCYDKTLERINRGHTFAQAQEAVKKTAERGIHQGAHFILGLPGESREEMLAMAPLINSLPIDSVKFHQLQIVKGTKMEKEFAQRPEDFVTFPLEGYIDFFIDLLEHLRPDLYIERFVGEVPPRFVNSTPWGLIRNVELLRMLETRLEERDTWQGRLY